MQLRTILPIVVPEKATMLYQADMVDENGAIISGSNLVTLTMTLYDKATQTIINSNDAKNILNANQGVIDSNGHLMVNLAPADNVFATATSRRESHIMLFQWTYGPGGVRGGKHEVEFPIVNLDKVATP